MEQTDILNKISKISGAIRQKYKLLKSGKDSSEQAANEIFKPIVTPLQALVENSKAIKYEIKHEENPQNYFLKKLEMSNTKPEISDYKTINDETNQNQSSYDDDDLNASSSSIINQTVLSPTPGMTSTPLKGRDPISYYISMLSRKTHKGLDTRFGVRKRNNQLFLGDSPVQFQDNTLTLKDKSYFLTPGLIELLFKSDPLERLVHDSDLNVYRELIITTNTHKKHYESDNSLYTDKSNKYKKYISKLTQLSIEGQGLPQFMSAERKRKNIDYVYWDDPNELVDRLRLLMASQAAGNSSHSNEIISIIDELREAQIIY